MGYFAKVSGGKVLDVIRAEQSEIDTGLWGDPAQWVQTSYNTRGGIYYIPNTDTPDPDQSKALRANYAGIAYNYDAVNDVFYAPQPGPGWTIGPPTWLWQEPPIPPTPTGSETITVMTSIDTIPMPTASDTITL